METINNQRDSLGKMVLTVIEEKYSNAEEILKKLKSKNIKVEKNHLHPVLSGLLINNYLCCNWIDNRFGIKEKYFYLTPAGFKIIHS